MRERFGLLGERLGHSFSPRLHALLGGYEYGLTELPPTALRAFFARRDFRGINVTIPYKQAVIPYLDTLSDTARRTGSVNTVVQDSRGQLHGYNTDYDGFVQTVRRLGWPVTGCKCLVLGSGGAGKTACAALRDLGAGEVVTISRGGADNYRTLSRHGDAALLVNATPVGMYPRNGEAPLDLTALPGLAGVIDLIYNPARTALLLQAERMGIPAVNGLYMLCAQARRAAELFTGRMIPAAEIDRAAYILARETYNIALIGMPGSGKTTLGRLLARRMGRPFIDTDALVEQRTGGRSCAAFLRQEGEAAFRRLETEAVREAGMRTGAVIATGGGTVTRAENLAPLRQNGCIFERFRPLDQLGVRERPLSDTPEKAAALYARRGPLYAAWRDAVITGETVEEAIAQAEAAFNDWIERESL